MPKSANLNKEVPFITAFSSSESLRQGDQAVSYSNYKRNIRDKVPETQGYPGSISRDSIVILSTQQKRRLKEN